MAEKEQQNRQTKMLKDPIGRTTNGRSAKLLRPFCWSTYESLETANYDNCQLLTFRF